MLIISSKLLLFITYKKESIEIYSILKKPARAETLTGELLVTELTNR